MELASEAGRDHTPIVNAKVASLGPVIQLARVRNRAFVERHLSLDSPRFDAIREFLNCPSGLFFEQSDNVGLMACSNNARDIDELMQRAFMAVCRSSLPKAAASQAVAALGEFESNVQEHCGQSETGVIGYEITAEYVGLFSSDLGMGVLDSLRTNPQHHSLDDAGDALQLLISDGVSRHVTAGHGNGFRPIFTGLANHTGFLRFRSGNAVLELNGFDQVQLTREIKERSETQGLHIFVHCRLN